jgi:hypothetical protein
LKEIGTTRRTYGNVLLITAVLGIFGWVISLYAGDYLSSNAAWLFNPVATYLPLPATYKQGSFIAQWLVYGLWFLLGGLVLTVFFKRNKATTGNSKFGSSRKAKR